MRSMIKLHEANAAPAVMSGKQTHPHLYDRLLAAGIQPDFPRPDPPGTRAAFAEVLAVAILDCIVLFAALIAVGVALHFAVGWDPSHNSDARCPPELLPKRPDRPRCSRSLSPNYLRNERGTNRENESQIIFESAGLKAGYVFALSRSDR